MKSTKSTKKTNKFVMVLLVFVILLSLGVTASCYLFSQGLIVMPVNANAVDAKAPDAPKKVETTQSTVLSSTDAAGQDYLDDTVFIGDSRTEGMYLNECISLEQTFAENGLNHQAAQTKAFVDIGNGNLYTIADALRIRTPKKVFVSFGINGIAWFSLDTFIEEYQKLLDIVKTEVPDSIIVVTSILPVTSGYEAATPNVTNEKIDEYNAALDGLAEKNGLYYLDFSAPFKDDNNDLIVDYQNGDGIHLNAAAYEVLMQQIYSHAIYPK